MARQECDYYGGEIYSTNEQVVGTWINGKLIYQKSATVTMPSAGGLQDVSYIPSIPFSTIDTLIGIEGTLDRGDGWVVFLGADYYPSGAEVEWMIDFNKQTQKLFFYLSNLTKNKTGVLTFRYTKTTD